MPFCTIRLHRFLMRWRKHPMLVVLLRCCVLMLLRRMQKPRRRILIMLTMQFSVRSQAMHLRSIKPILIVLVVFFLKNYGIPAAGDCCCVCNRQSILRVWIFLMLRDIILRLFCLFTRAYPMQKKTSVRAYVLPKQCLILRLNLQRLR